MTPEQLFSDLLATRAAQPFVTFYDEATGERSELSAKSLANWVAKTHHLLVDELGLGPGDAAYLALPAHWISVPALLGTLSAGLHLLDGTAADPAAAEVAFVEPATSAAAVAAAIPDIYAIDPNAAARGFADSPPIGTADYVSAVRPQADAWASVQLRASEQDPCLAGLSRAEVVELATARAAQLGLTTGGRALSTRPWTAASDWVDTVLAPLAVGGSIVFVANAPDEDPDNDVVQRRMSQERATVRI